jgi:ligand-binding sensor domain-containing protein
MTFGFPPDTITTVYIDTMGNNCTTLNSQNSPQEDHFRSKHPNASHNPYGVYSIFKDRKNHVWFGTSDMGVYRFDGTTISYLYEKQLTVTPNDGSFGIRSIAEDKNGYFWICNANYKYEILNTNALNNGQPSKIPYKRITGVKSEEYFLSIVADDNEDLWMLTYDNGVWRNNGHELIHYPLEGGENNAKLFSLYKDKKGGLWLGTQHAGVYKFNGKSFEKFEINPR